MYGRRIGIPEHKIGMQDTLVPISLFETSKRNSERGSCEVQTEILTENEKK